MRARAFTLLEVLLTLGLIGMLAGSIFGFMWNVTRVRDAMSSESRDAQAGAALMERIEGDILCGLAGDEGVGAGIAGTATTLKVLTRGIALPGGAGTAAEQDLQWSEIMLDRSAGVAKGRRGTLGGQAEFEVITEHLAWGRLRYFDGREWLASFDSLKADGLPVAIEVALWFGPAWKPSDALEQGSDSAESAGNGTSRGASADAPERAPDRLRIIVVPDGPVAAWRDGP